MKKLLIALACLFILSARIFAQEEVLTNKSVLDMMELGFSEDIILTKIETSEANFDTSIEALKDLKAKGVSDAVIKSIMSNEHKDKESEKEKKENKTGIYTRVNGEFVKILPTVFSGTKTNTLASAFTYGIANAKIKSTLNGATSRNVIPYNKPEFFFYFKKSSNDAFAATNWWFLSATSPNEFVLTKLVSKRNKRELQTGKVNIYAGSNMGIDEESAIKFNIIPINDFSFKVETEEPLAPGEYCFFYQGVIPQGGFTNQSVFDFSIQGNE